MTTVEQEIQRNYKFNFIVNLLDGAFFWCGASFIATSTIMPLYISRLTDSKIAIGLLSVIGSTGWLFPQLFTANQVQRLPRKKVWPVNLGLFTERLPVLMLALSTLLAVKSPMLALIAALVCLAWHIFGAGFVAVAWQDMIGKIIPQNHRGRFFGITNFLGTAMGVVGAIGVRKLLDYYQDDFPTGYLWSFSIGAALMLFSWIFLAMTREPAQESKAEPISQKEYWRRLPAILKADANFRNYLFSRIIAAFGGMAGGFLTVYAVQRWSLSDGQAGAFTTSMLLGQALSNLVFGPLADRKGHKLVLTISSLLGVLGVGLAVLAPHYTWFYAVFALLGVKLAGFMLSGIMIALEFCTPEQRATYVGLNNTFSGVAGGLAPVIGAGLAQVLGYQPLFAIAFVIGLAGVGLLWITVQEPRKVEV